MQPGACSLRTILEHRLLSKGFTFSDSSICVYFSFASFSTEFKKKKKIRSVHPGTFCSALVSFTLLGRVDGNAINLSSAFTFQTFMSVPVSELRSAVMAISQFCIIVRSAIPPPPPRPPRTPPPPPPLSVSLPRILRVFSDASTE